MSKEAIEAMRPHIEKLKRCVRINDEMGRVVYGQTEAITALAEIFDNTEAALSTLPIAGEAPEGWQLVPKDDATRQFADSALPREMIDAGADALEKASDDLRNYVAGETIDWDHGMEAVAVYRAMLTVAPSSTGKDGGREVEAVKTVWQVADAIDPERSPDGGWRDQLLNEIHADLENRGRRDKNFAVTVHHRNIVISAVSKALRGLPSASEEQQP